jgi:hypothetical protein
MDYSGIPEQFKRALKEYKLLASDVSVRVGDKEKESEPISRRRSMVIV